MSLDGCEAGSIRIEVILDCLESREEWKCARSD